MFQVCSYYIILIMPHELSATHLRCVMLSYAYDNIIGYLIGVTYGNLVHFILYTHITLQPTSVVLHKFQ